MEDCPEGSYRVPNTSLEPLRNDDWTELYIVRVARLSLVQAHIGPTDVTVSIPSHA